MPLASELIGSREIAPRRPEGQDTVLESGVLAFRREHNGEPRVLLISRRRSKKWGIPKGKLVPALNFPENAAKEAFEEAGVIGHVSPSSVGMFRAKKRTGNPPIQQIIEVWVYLLEVTETLPDWPEKEKRTTRWVTCEVATRTSPCASLSSARADLVRNIALPPPPGGRFGSPLVLSWVRPEMVVEVSCVEMRPDGLLRHVIYLGERKDQPATEVGRNQAI